MKKLTLMILLVLTISPSSYSKESYAIFAGGCFWCMEKPFEQIPGVKSVVSGYIGGNSAYPAYKDVASGKTGHYEAVKITYDSKVTNFNTLLYVFWQQINATDSGGQFVDRGQQYSTGIFYLNPQQKKLAEQSKNVLSETKILSKKIVTPIIKATTFYKAEEYHQDYYKNNPVRYWYYRNGSGRDKYLNSVWDDKKRAKFKIALNKRISDKVGRTK